MKHNKNLYTGILLASTLIFTGCGSNDDSDAGIINGENSSPIVNN